MSISECSLSPSFSYSRIPLLSLHFVEATSAVFHNGKILDLRGRLLRRRDTGYEVFLSSSPISIFKIWILVIMKKGLNTLKLIISSQLIINSSTFKHP
jgi:hypothetical protein